MKAVIGFDAPGASFRNTSSARVMAVTCIVLALMGCSHAATPAGKARNKSPAPRLVQASAEYPGWAVFSPLGTSPLLAIAAGFSTHVWASQPGANAILRIAFDGTFDSIKIPTAGASPGQLVAGPRGDMWVVESNASRIGEIGMPDGPIVEFVLPKPDELPIALAMGTDRNIWYIDGGSGAGTIGRLTSSGKVTEFHTRLMTGGTDLVVSPSGAIWFSGIRATNGTHTTGIVGQTTTTGSITEYELKGSDLTARSIAVGGDGNAWVSVDRHGNYGQIVRVTPSGATTFYRVGGQPGAIAPYGPDKLDFTIDDEATYGEIALDGSVTYMPLPGGPSARAVDIAVGSNGNEWFSGSLDGKSAVFVRLPSKIDVTPVSVTLHAPGDSQKLTVSEKKYSGKWSVKSSDDGIVDVTKGKTLDTFTIVAISDGTCTVTVADKKGNSVTIPVTVK